MAVITRQWEFVSLWRGFSGFFLNAYVFHVQFLKSRVCFLFFKANSQNQTRILIQLHETRRTNRVWPQDRKWWHGPACLLGARPQSGLNKLPAARPAGRARTEAKDSPAQAALGQDITDPAVRTWKCRRAKMKRRHAALTGGLAWAIPRA